MRSNARQIEMLGPLPLQVGLVQRGQEELREDVAELRRDMDRRLDKQSTELREWQGEFSRQVKSDLIHCSNEIGKVAEGVKEWQASETKRREAQETTVQQTAIARFTSRYGFAGVCFAAILGSLTAIIIAIFGGGGT